MSSGTIYLHYSDGKMGPGSIVDPPVPPSWMVLWGVMPDGVTVDPLPRTVEFDNMVEAMAFAAEQRPEKIRVNYQGTEFLALGG